MNHKLIMEGWRKFLGMDGEKKTSDFDPAQTCMIALDQKGRRKKIILYNPRGIRKLSRKEMRNGDHYTEIEMIGSIDLVISTIISKEPCIADTYQIASIYVADAYRGNGLQKQLMDMAFYMVSEEGAGLTSDHQYGTRPKAAGAWEKIEKSSSYEKKATSKGNDTFDYDESTSDPNDDCSKPKKDPSATEHSFEKKSNATGRNLYDRYGSQHKVIANFMKSKFVDVGDFEDAMKRIANSEFRSAYANS
jgi:GNAT superfamily N-acetyltransferase